MVLLMRWLVDMKGAYNIMLLASESPAACLLSCFPCAFSVSIAHIAAFQYILNLIFSIFAMSIKLPHIIYVAQLILIIESITLNYQILNIYVQHIIGTCCISICWLCSIRYHDLDDTSSKILVNTGLKSDEGNIVRIFLP